MKVFALLLGLVLSFGLLMTACSSDDLNNDTTGDRPAAQSTADRDNDDASSTPQITKDEFEAEAREQLDAIDRQLDEARSRLSNETGDQRDAIAQRIDDLEERRETVADKLEDLRSSNSSDWTEVREDIEDELDEIASDLRTAVNEL
jgi:hypothetical protein